MWDNCGLLINQDKGLSLDDAPVAEDGNSEEQKILQIHLPFILCFINSVKPKASMPSFWLTPLTFQNTITTR